MSSVCAWAHDRNAISLIPEMVCLVWGRVEVKEEGAAKMRFGTVVRRRGD